MVDMVWCGLCVRLQQAGCNWLGSDGVSRSRAEELQKRFEQHSLDELFIISDLDVSQNKLSLDQRLDW